MKTILQLLSVLCALIAGILMVPSMIPFLGWGNWGVLVFVVAGCFFGMFCDRKIGLTLSVIVGLVAALRLFLGGGVV